MPNKSVKIGLRIFMRCEADGYCYDYWLNMGNHDLFHGRFFTSISLVGTLLHNGIFSCGTIKCDSEGVPPELRNPDLRVETLQMQHGQLLATAWKDNKMDGSGPSADWRLQR